MLLLPLAGMAGGNREGGEPLNVEVIMIPKCEAGPQTVRLVEETMRQMGVKGTVEQIVIHDTAEANRYRFLGSPTVRINGLDIEPSRRSEESFGPAWRRYGASSMPGEELVRSALKEALGR